MAYLFDKHYGQCSLADDETGIVIDWTSGDFNDSQQVHTEGLNVPDGEDLASWVASRLREMGDYIAANYPEEV
ncbi:MAG: hypothetical protein MJY60_04040 [Bacteroidales bacterium]|nr:hypothetical protein [Bacteroidales bacterium]